MVILYFWCSFFTRLSAKVSKPPNLGGRPTVPMIDNFFKIKKLIIRNDRYTPCPTNKLIISNYNIINKTKKEIFD